MIINTTHDYQSKIGSFEVIVERATNSNPNLVTCVFLYVRLVAFFTMSSHWLMTMLSFVLIDRFDYFSF